MAVAAELPGIRLLTLHTLGGVDMMRAAAEAVAGRKKRPALLGVTILTSHDAATLRSVGIGGTPGTRALVLAKLAKKAGLDGVVASAHEARAIRCACGPRFLIVVPGVRPASASANDQSRVATPAEAIRAGRGLSGDRAADHRGGKPTRGGAGDWRRDRGGIQIKGEGPGLKPIIVCPPFQRS